MGLRVALYASLCLWRNVGSRRSNMTQSASGFSSSSRRCRMFRKPKTAFVGVPSGAESGRTP